MIVEQIWELYLKYNKKSKALTGGLLKDIKGRSLFIGG